MSATCFLVINGTSTPGAELTAGKPTVVVIVGNRRAKIRNSAISVDITLQKQLGSDEWTGSCDASDNVLAYSLLSLSCSPILIPRVTTCERPMRVHAGCGNASISRYRFVRTGK